MQSRFKKNILKKKEMSPLTTKPITQEFNNNVAQLFDMVWGKGRPVKNIELGDLVENTRTSFLMLNKLQKSSFSESPTWLLDALDLIEDSMGIDDEYTTTTLIFNYQNLPKVDEINSAIGSLNKSSNINKNLNTLTDILDDLSYKVFKLNQDSVDLGVASSVRELTSFSYSSNPNKPISNRLKQLSQNLSESFDNYKSNSLSKDEFLNDFGVFMGEVQSNSIVTKLKLNEALKDTIPDIAPNPDKNNFADNLLAAVNKETPAQSKSALSNKHPNPRSGRKF